MGTSYPCPLPSLREKQMKRLQFSEIRVWFVVALLPLVLLMMSGNRAAGQGITTGGISGEVVDPAGAYIANATITATSLETDFKTVQHSRADGTFTLVNLPAGDYTITIEAAGFEALKLSKITVAIGQSAIGAQKLKVGSSGEVVQVQGDETPLLTTTQAQVAATIDTQQIENLPFGGGFDTAALLTPGVVITHDNSFSNSNGAYGGFSSQGERGRSNNNEIDGQSNNDNSVAGPQVFFSNPDAISSIEVITNNFSAQYGRNAGSVINYITKSGSNAYHGSVFEWYEGNWGESFLQGQKDPYQGFCPPGVTPVNNSCIVPTLPRYVDNRFGGSFGGRLIRDKLFFFSSAYFDRYRNGGGTSTSGASVTPTPAGITALQSAFPGDPGRQRRRSRSRPSHARFRRFPTTKSYWDASTGRRPRRIICSCVTSTRMTHISMPEAAYRRATGTTCRIRPTQWGRTWSTHFRQTGSISFATRSSKHPSCFRAAVSRSA